MTKQVEPIPSNRRSATPYLCCRNAFQALEFYKNAFGAKETMRIDMPDGRVGHAEIEIGEAALMLSDEFAEWNIVSPQALGGSPVIIHLYVLNVDQFVSQAEKHGAKILCPVANQFYGDRSGRIQDPFGHIWSIGTHIEDVSLEELKKRSDALFGAKEN